jgi:alkylhydroperoxidase family enzyme
MTRPHFLSDAPDSPGAQHLYEHDLAEDGYVMNVSRLWAHEPVAHEKLFDLITHVWESNGMTFRQRGILVGAAASALGDSVCSLVWGSRLAAEADPSTAAAVLSGRDDGLTPKERAMAAWARKVVRDPNGTTPRDVQDLRDAGWTDDEIFGLTVFSALRVAFSTVNDALGARPDTQLLDVAPQAVLDAVDYGRPIDEPVEDTVTAG